jgi:hypothetical protein
MALPKVVVRGRKVILLSGFEKDVDNDTTSTPAVHISAKDKLNLAALRNPDAVAFGYVAGRWVAVA